MAAIPGQRRKKMKNVIGWAIECVMGAVIAAAIVWVFMCALANWGY
jgi:hypothetical protein